MSDINIWSGVDFSGSFRKSAYEYLLEQRSGLIALTSGVLTMDVESVSGSSGSDGGIIYTLYIVSKGLGGYRRKILTVSQSIISFPVDITYSDLNGLDISEKNVLEDDFLNRITQILQTPSIKLAIEYLYLQSRR